MKKLLLSASLIATCAFMGSAEVTTILMDNLSYSSSTEKLYRMYSDAFVEENPISTDNFYIEFSPSSTKAINTQWQFGTLHFMTTAQAICAPQPGITISKITFVCRDNGYKSGTINGFTHEANSDEYVWTGSCSFPDEIEIPAPSTQVRIMLIKVEYSGTPSLPLMPVTNVDERAIPADRPITLTAADGAEIYYTTDGTEPDTESKRYTGPITLDEPGVVQIRAIAVSNNNYSAPLVRSYFVTEAGTTITTFNFSTMADYAPIARDFTYDSSNNGRIDLTASEYIEKEGVKISPAEGYTPPYIYDPNSLRGSNDSYYLFQMGSKMGINIAVDPSKVITDVYVMGKTGSTNLKFDETKTPGSVKYIMGALAAKYDADPTTPTSNVILEQKSGSAQMEVMYVAYKDNPSSGISNIEVDNSDNTTTYFNLQGVQVPAENLTPGIYIKRQGTKSEKLLVK